LILIPAQAISSSWRTARASWITGFRADSIRAVAEQIGTAYLIKPLGPLQLDAMISEIRNQAAP
jgi:hypothetical protein